MNLEDLRQQIDGIDTDIVKLIAERIRTAQQIGEEKRAQGKRINDLGREEKVLAHIKDIAQGESIDQDIIADIYQQLIAVCRSTQGTEVAFQGERGAYGEEAAFRFFGPLVETKACESLIEVFKRVEGNGIQFGIIPVENSLEGSISQSYDLLLESNLKVCGELELRVSHCLIANPGVKLEAVKSVYSHPQALGQCRTFLKHLGVKLFPAADTAGSVRLIKEKGLTDAGAIASARAAKIYDMPILAREIEDNPNNFTRFFILSHKDCPPSGKDKTSIVFSVKDKPSALYDFLKEFATRGVNLTKIESRPTRHKPWEYNFYMDFEGHREDKIPAEVLASLEEHTIFVKILGSYPKSK